MAGAEQRASRGARRTTRCAGGGAEAGGIGTRTASPWTLPDQPSSSALLLLHHTPVFTCVLSWLAGYRRCQVHSTTSVEWSCAIVNRLIE